MIQMSAEGMSNEEALVCENPVSRIMARGVASSWPEACGAWVNAEIRRPEVDIPHLLHAWASLFVQTYGSVAAQIMKPAGDEFLKNCLIRCIDEELIEHMQRTRRENAQ